MKLYKFRSFQKFERIVDILVNKRFFLSSWKELNDPMEGYFSYIICESELWYRKIVSRFIDEKTELRICSFSNTIKPILLWSHYADSHEGIAIEVTINSKEFNSLYRVKYRKNIPELNFDIDQTPYNVLASKINFWAYEREYRIIDKRESIYLPNITGVYYGLRTTDFDKDRVKSLLSNTIPTYETKLNIDKSIITV